MNQAIQFPDREEWNREIDAMCFPALVNGISLTCAISASELQHRYGNEHLADKLFSAHRWDLEEEAQTLIEQQKDDDQGWVWLSSAR
ncbi:DUF1488 domain-containing protein [Duffyella gerundensis]|uniref:DUF1488 domain-containing protein n=1 Tax=Duffyella TaxID=3026546 RepID=UPI003F6DCAC5